MLFNSLEFILLFLPIVFVGFFALSKHQRHGQTLAAVWLCASSLFFYGWWDARYVLLLMGSICFNFVMGRVQLCRQGERWPLVVAVGVNVALLGVYKYAGWLTWSFNSVSGASLPVPELALPLGISFFTFTQIAFQVDVARGLAQEYKFTHYALFVTYFPHLIAGPILHHRQMMPQFAKPETYRLQLENVALGLSIFAVGLAKKVLLADRIGEFASPVFSSAASGTAPTLGVAWTGALAYTFQIYFDFSGYSDMAIGLSWLFGISLPLNFNSPYKAWNIIEFWRRWHMSLSAFLKDYLYIPLGGSRRGHVRRYLNLMLTMLLGGLWHGANWTFVVWGGLHGLYLCVNHAWRKIKSALGLGQGAPTRLGRASACGLSFIAVVVAWVFFKAESFTEATAVLRGMAGMGGISLPLSARPLGIALLPPALATRVAFDGVFAGHAVLMGLGAFRFALLLAVAAGITWLLPNTQEVFLQQGAAEKPGRMLRWTPSRAWAATLGFLLALSVMDMQRISEFLYFRF